MSAPPRLPSDFRKLPIEARRAALAEALKLEDPFDAPRVELADTMVESAVGYLSVPLGIATGFLIDGAPLDIPMAVEEPSVIAAATFAGRLIASEGGFETWADEPEMTTQLFLEGVPEGRETELLDHDREIRAKLDEILASMARRGGGYRGMEVARLPETGVVRVDIHVDVRDAMGANLLNSASEHVRATVEALSGGVALMCILSNDASRRRAGASFSISSRRLAKGGASGAETARRIEAAGRVAAEDPSRAVTHNKGVMNGVSALALATGNDTRGVEAGVHLWAARSGRSRPVSAFRASDSRLEGTIELPLALATTGGSVGTVPAAAMALALLGRPGSRELARIAAALGLAQNFAALFALVTGGIQEGHMRYQSARLAARVGARGKEIRELASRLAAEKSTSVEAAEALLARMRKAKA